MQEHTLKLSEDEGARNYRLQIMGEKTSCIRVCMCVSVNVSVVFSKECEWGVNRCGKKLEFNVVSGGQGWGHRRWEIPVW